MKSPGQLAYERDLIIDPVYHDGGTRPAWERLSAIAQWSWERQPNTANEAWTAQKHEEILAGLVGERYHSRIADSDGRPRRWTYNLDGTMAEVGTLVTCPQCLGVPDLCNGYCDDAGTVTVTHAQEWHRQNGVAA